MQLTTAAKLPRPIRYLYYLYVKYIKGDVKWATLVRNFGPKSPVEQWKLVARREAFRARWFDWWNNESQQYDFILCPANATPALPHKAMHDAFASCGYTFLWNLLDYTAGVIPVSHVDATRDALKAPYRSLLKSSGCDNGIARGAWMHYDSVKMAGLPTAVQIVGRRLQEEKVLTYMDIVEKALEARGEKYTLLELD